MSATTEHVPTASRSITDPFAKPGSQASKAMFRNEPMAARIDNNTPAFTTFCNAMEALFSQTCEASSCSPRSTQLPLGGAGDSCPVRCLPQRASTAILTWNINWITWPHRSWQDAGSMPHANECSWKKTSTWTSSWTSLSLRSKWPVTLLCLVHRFVLVAQ